MASGSRGDMDRRRWSDLPADVLQEISGRVRDAADFVNIHAVCKQWRGSRDPLSRRARTTRTQFLPWLLAPPDQEPVCTLFNIVSPSPVPRENWVCSTDAAGVWYLAVNEHFHPSLHDPLTGAVAHLPTFPWEEEFDPCGVIYDDGTTFLHSIDAGYGSEWFRAALLRPGDAEWTAVQRTIQAPDHGKFYATYHSGRILVTVEAGQWYVPRPPRLPWEKGPYSRRYSHVLESCGELLWVVVQVQLCRYTCTTGIRPGLSVVVHALGEDTTKHSHSLTDRVLFLGWPNRTAGVSTSSTVQTRPCHVKRLVYSGTTSSMTISRIGTSVIKTILRVSSGCLKDCTIGGAHLYSFSYIRNSMRGR
ncbi:hypothetical protein VPH35_099658 [Triticum aestivum]